MIPLARHGGQARSEDMEQRELVGKIQTVLGAIDPSSLGITLPHEHLLADLTAYFVEPVEPDDRKMAHEPVRIDNRYWVTQHCIGSLDDLLLTDEQVAIKEAMHHKSAGGGAIVELSNIGLGRDPLGLARISRATGLRVVMGSGYYLGISHPPEVAAMTEGEIADVIVGDILTGVGGTGVRAGIIGEIGCSLPLEENEKKVLRASVVAQRRTGAALNIHPSLTGELLLEIIAILRDAGADLSRTIISHIAGMCFGLATRRRALEAGCYVCYDGFGWPTLHRYQGGYILDRLSDPDAINDIMRFASEGYLDHILVSGDICFKHLLASYGGQGFGYIVRDVAPAMRRKGMTEEQVQALLVDNPRRILTFVDAVDA
jgi:phosphotriesterase-related protein